MDEYVNEVASLLEQAERSYGGGVARTSRLPGWERFYAWRLLGWAGLPQALGRSVSIRELTDALTMADAAYRAESPESPWAEFYARSLLTIAR